MPNLQPMGIKAVAENVGKFNRQVGSMNKSITNNTKALGKAEKAGKAMRTNLFKLAGGAAAVTAGFLAVQKALAFGREGALITQTAQSFDFLLQKIGAAPDLLNQLKRASKGTISEMSLMTSTATLLAGAGDQLAKKLADATPQLLEIAKAANKLNPALGSTAFLYQSIATGVKRAQPLILDNLGITIKVGEANKKFAESIGKTVDQLDAQEKAMAILQGTLEAGGNLIDQVGGDTDSLTDGFDRLTVAIEETTDAIKKRAAPSIAKYVEFLPLWLNWNEKLTDSLGDHEANIIKTSRSYEDYLREIERVNSLTMGYGVTLESLDRSTFNYLQNVKELNPELRLQSNLIPRVGEALGNLQERLRPALTLDINILLAESALEAASSRLFKWSQEQQNKLRLQVQLDFAAEASAAGGAGLAEFQHGGQFTVGGKPGVDTNLVAFRATRGEVVTVTPAGNVDNRSVNTGDIHMGGGGMSEQSFDRMMRSWLGA